MSSKKEIQGIQKPVRKLENKQSGLNSFWANGDNNLYPLYVSRTIQGSPTGSRAHKLNADYVAGTLSIKDVIVNSKKGYYLSNIIKASARDLVSQGAFFVHRNIFFDANSERFLTEDTSVIPYEHVRINKQDDNGHYSIFFVSERFASIEYTNFEKDKPKKYYKYTDNQDEIRYQIKDFANKNDIDIETDEGFVHAVRSFPGQIFYANHEMVFPYPYSPLESVLLDMETEYYISVYANTQSTTGFLGKAVAFVVEDSHLDEDEDHSKNDDLESFLGAEGSGGIYVQRIKNTDDPDKLMNIKTFDSVFDDKMHEVTAKRIRKNILGVFDNLPELLVFSGEGALFGTNPETFENAKTFYKENTREKREYLAKVISMITNLDFEL